MPPKTNKQKRKNPALMLSDDDWGAVNLIRETIRAKKAKYQRQVLEEEKRRYEQFRRHMTTIMNEYFKFVENADIRNQTPVMRLSNASGIGHPEVRGLLSVAGFEFKLQTNITCASGKDSPWLIWLPDKEESEE